MLHTEYLSYVYPACWVTPQHTYAASLIPQALMILSIAVVVTVALLPLVNSQSTLHKQWAPSTKSAHSDYLKSCCLKMCIHLVPYSTCFGAEQMYVSSVMAWLNRVCMYRNIYGSTLFELTTYTTALKPLCCVSFTCDSMSDISVNTMTVV